MLDLQTCDQKMLENEFGQHQVQTMIKLSYGVDDSPVTPYTQPQVSSLPCCLKYSRESHFKEITNDSAQKRHKRS